jgi:hypothetical protein
MLPLLGGVPDKPDPRDRVRVTAPAPVPPQFSLKPHGITTPWDQKQVGACSGYATTAAVQNLFGRLGGAKWEPSPLGLYYWARELAGHTGIDAGAQLRDVMKALVARGVPPAFAHPTADWRAAPDQRCQDLAAGMRIRDYQRIPVGPDAPTEMCAYLHQEQLPLIVAVRVHASIYKGPVNFAGVIQLPVPGDVVIGWHALMVDSYDTDTQRFSGWNSWGKAWGWGGRFSLPFEYFQRYDLAADVWSFSPGYW